MPRLSGALLKMSLSVTPRNSMYDDLVQIIAVGLKPRQRVAISTHVDHESGIYSSKAHFEANQDGVVDCTTQPSIGGSYIGVDPVGLFWSLTASPGQRRGLRFTPRNVSKPIRYRFRLEQTADETVTIHCPETTVDELSIDRHLLHPSIRRMDVEVGRVRGTLFIMKDPPHPLPGVIDMFGTGGGLIEHRAALLAAAGFAVFTVAFFNYKDLPADLGQTELEYFEEAVKWLLSLPHVMPHSCAAVGTSLGGDIVLRMGIHFLEVIYSVAINGLHMLDSFNPISYRGQLLPMFHGDPTTIDMADQILYYGPWRKRIPTNQHLMHPVELASKDTNFLIFASEEDDCNPSVHAALKLKQRFEQHGRAEQFEMVRFPGAGHLLELPYTPHCSFSWHKLFGSLLSNGGDAVSHNLAQNKMWGILKQRLAHHIGKPATVPRFLDVSNKA